jgi:signal transduction histidine kinase
MAMVPEPEGRTLERGFMFTVVPTRNAAGEVTGTMVYAEDVTERSLYEREKSRERLRLMVEHAEQVALALFEASSGELLHASPRYVEMVERSVGAKREKVVGGKWQELSFLPSGREAWELFQDAVLRGEPRRLAEVRRPAVDGMESVWDCSLIPIPAERQRDTVEFVLVSAVEVTDQVRAREELQRLDRLKDEFLSMASHELRTPLVPLTTYTELLNRMVGERDKGAEWDKRFAEMMEKLRRQLRHLSRMTDDLLDVGRLQSGKFGLERTPVDLRALLPEIAVQARTLDSRRQLRVDVPAATDGVAVVGDEQRLTQVILNLVENAYKYGDPTEEVVLRASREEEDGRGWAVLEVEDGGPGIPEREQARLFKRFYQGSREGRPARRGLGLGLYIARAIVEQHEGSIDLDPEYRRGTRVRIRLPLAT